MNMCQECEKNPVYEFTNKRKLCKNCFIKWFFKKFLYTIRKFKMIRPGDVIGYENKGDFRGVVLEDLLKDYSKNMDVEIYSLPSKKKITKKAETQTLDIASYKVINELIRGSAKKFKEISPKKGKTIKPLYYFLDKEIELYAKLKNLKFKKIKNKEKKDKISIFIDNLEEKHPEIKRAIVQNYTKSFDEHVKSYNKK